MTTDTTPTTEPQSEIIDDELAAMAKVLAALKNLEPSIQQNVIEWAVRRFKLKSPCPSPASAELAPETSHLPEGAGSNDDLEPDGQREASSIARDEQGDLDGINVVARKWIRRAGLTENQLSKLFSLGVDDIDLVTKSVPGKKKIERLKNILLLQGVAAYLGSGVARVDWSKLKESASHYDADAGGNFPAYLKSFGAEATGSVASGFTLTSRGLNDAKELI